MDGVGVAICGVGVAFDVGLGVGAGAAVDAGVGAGAAVGAGVAVSVVDEVEVVVGRRRARRVTGRATVEAVAPGGGGASSAAASRGADGRPTA
ncbi:MAG: hypothetical protein JWO02_3525 [Solirubrobacterales bacterium]|nr:hypothetical protein [Solirubrobacterales bacterium]